MKLFDLKGKVAIVTGGNGGIGLAMAKAMAEAGAAIIVAGRNATKNAAAVKDISALGAKAIALPADMTDEKSCRAMVADAAKHFGRIDILINNAGMSIRRLPQELTVAEWNTVLSSNLTGAFICSQAVHPEFKKVGGGKIINIASMMSIFGLPFAVAYGTSKGGMVQMTKSMAVAWAPDNIQVNAVLPGWIETELTRNARSSVPGLQERVVARSPVGRWGVPDDMAGVAAFLASSASDFVTGAAIPVDGGFSVAM